jgi:hypothetical protein
MEDSMLYHIRDVASSKQACENLKKVYVTSTIACKLQLEHELNDLRQQDMSVIEYPTKIKAICNYDRLHQCSGGQGRNDVDLLGRSGAVIRHI